MNRSLSTVLAVALLAVTASGAAYAAPTKAEKSAIVKSCKADHKGDKAAIKACIKEKKAAK